MSSCHTLMLYISPSTYTQLIIAMLFLAIFSIFSSFYEQTSSSTIRKRSDTALLVQLLPIYWLESKLNYKHIVDIAFISRSYDACIAWHVCVVANIVCTCQLSCVLDVVFACCSALIQSLKNQRKVFLRGQSHFLTGRRLVREVVVAQMLYSGACGGRVHFYVWC